MGSSSNDSLWWWWRHQTLTEDILEFITSQEPSLSLFKLMLILADISTAFSSFVRFSERFFSSSVRLANWAFSLRTIIDVLKKWRWTHLTRTIDDVKSSRTIFLSIHSIKTFHFNDNELKKKINCILLSRRRRRQAPTDCLPDDALTAYGTMKMLVTLIVDDWK